MQDPHSLVPKIRLIEMFDFIDVNLCLPGHLILRI